MIIGPRTMEQLEGYLDSEAIHLTDEVLDRVDEIVAPGVTVDPADATWTFGTRALVAVNRRR